MADQVAKRYQKEALPILVKEFNPIKVLFFGSRVKGGATKDSDLDVIVVSPVFHNIKFVKRNASGIKKSKISKACRLFMLYERRIRKNKRWIGNNKRCFETFNWIV